MKPASAKQAALEADAARYRNLQANGLANWSAVGKPYVVINVRGGTAQFVDGKKLDRLLTEE